MDSSPTLDKQNLSEGLGGEEGSSGAESQGCWSRRCPFPAEVRTELEDFLFSLAPFLPDPPPGAIPTRHLEYILKALQLDPSPLDMQMLAASTGSESEDYVLSDINGCLEYFMGRKSSPLELARVYSQLDPEDKGHISLEDLRRAAFAAGEDMSDIELQELIDAADESKSGFVSKEDFFRFIKEVHFCLKGI